MLKNGRGLIGGNGEAAKIGDDEKLWALEAAHAIMETMCLNFGDFLYRRTPLVLCRPDHGEVALNPVIRGIFKDFLGINDAQLGEQIQEFNDYLRQELAWRQPR
jgi:glycerol-3-phosphate dehydrogenase